jgi:hypothetical protein
MAFMVNGNGELYVDTAFINQVQHSVPDTVLKHLGFGDFALDFKDGRKVTFDRIDVGVGPDIPGQEGRKHRVRGDVDLVRTALAAMGADSGTLDSLR